MVEVSPVFTTLINSGAFLAFMVVGGLQIYLGRSMHPEKKITFPWINLAFGTFLIGMNYLMQALFSTQISGDPIITVSSYLLIIGGAAMSFTSFLILYTERSNEVSVLKSRQQDLQEIMNRLKKKFLTRELPEDEMKKIDTDIVRELAEIEVKLEKLQRKSR